MDVLLSNAIVITELIQHIVAMVYYENLLNRGEITIDDYIIIERDIAHKYKMEVSILEWKKRACDYGSKIEKIEL